MASYSDPFRPRHEPARSIYDAFQQEAMHRRGRSVEEWSAAEVDAVLKAANDYAKANGLPPVSRQDVERAERYARGSIDYGAKWAYAVTEKLQR